MNMEIVDDMPTKRTGKSPYYTLLKKYEELPAGKVLKIKTGSPNQAITIYRFFKRHGIKAHTRELPDAIYVFTRKL